MEAWRRAVKGKQVIDAMGCYEIKNSGVKEGIRNSITFLILPYSSDLDKNFNIESTYR